MISSSPTYYSSIIETTIQIDRNVRIQEVNDYLPSSISF